MNPRSSVVTDTTQETSFPTSFGYKPWLLQSQGTKKFTKFIDPFDGNIEARRVPELEDKRCYGFFDGEWLLLLDLRSNEMFFMNLFDLDKKIQLPPMSEFLACLGGCVVSSSPTNPKCLVIFAPTNQTFLLYCQPDDQKWTKADSNRHYNFSGDIVFAKGYIFALLSDGLTVYTSLESLMGIPDWDLIMFPDYAPLYCDPPHLSVSGEDVFFISACLSQPVISGISVWSLQDLHTGDPEWEVVRSIDQHIFYISGHQSMSFTVNDEKSERNCIYILQSDAPVEYYYKISLDDQTACLKLFHYDTTKGLNAPLWIVPSR
jgi:hypothetical protein